MKEMLDVVDSEDRFIRKATREEVTKKALMHRVARVIIVDGKGRFLFQKRASSKQMYPSHWDVGVAETVKSGEDYKEAALRGMEEEAGIKTGKISQLFKIRYHSKQTNEFCSVYELNGNFDGDQIKKQDSEIEELRFLAQKDFSKMKKLKFHPVGMTVLHKYMGK